MGTGVKDKHLTKILLFQKKVLRFIFFANRNVYAIPLFIDANILPVGSISAARTAGSFTEQRFVVEFNLPVAGSDSGNWREMERGGERALFPPLLTVFFTSSSSLSKRLQNRKSSTKCAFPELAG